MPLTDDTNEGTKLDGALTSKTVGRRAGEQSTD